MQPASLQHRPRRTGGYVARPRPLSLLPDLRNSSGIGGGIVLPGLDSSTTKVAGGKDIKVWSFRVAMYFMYLGSTTIGLGYPADLTMIATSTRINLKKPSPTSFDALATVNTLCSLVLVFDNVPNGQVGIIDAHAMASIAPIEPPSFSFDQIAWIIKCSGFSGVRR
ncbi:hypothetical protein K470DRAFT_62902 [Piedraia hortae CBS 480.64]|uniref:Uncharacterized protein n=1 Tax=Piedraia hortae CBS 480.64 TaxID=1314780 RepID=A0A6A7C1C6_9PEZI|nr:hypothetical protein K470DRAFT_62902 [Piedraia hortae CBS 480.64]